VHRIGRTGRAGNVGEAVSLVCIDELQYLKDIEKLTKQSIKKMFLEGFEVDPTIEAKPLSKRGQQRAGGGNSSNSRNRGRGGRNSNNSQGSQRRRQGGRSENKRG